MLSPSASVASVRFDGDDDLDNRSLAEAGQTQAQSQTLRFSSGTHGGEAASLASSTFRRPNSRSGGLPGFVDPEKLRAVGKTRPGVYCCESDGQIFPEEADQGKKMPAMMARKDTGQTRALSQKEVEDQAWARYFCSQVIEGQHSAMTRDFIFRVLQPDYHETECARTDRRRVPIDLAPLRAALTAAKHLHRQQLAREWLEKNRDKVLPHWRRLGFPLDSQREAFSLSGGAPDALPALAGTASVIVGADKAQTSPIRRSADGCAVVPPMACGLAIFDFDKVLTVVDSSMAMARSNAQDIVFGGAERVHMLHKLFDHLTSIAELSLAIVSFNSEKVILEALDSVGLASYFPRSLIFGWETTDWEPKSYTINHRIIASSRKHSERRFDKNTVIFLDDDPANVRDVNSACSITVIHVPRGGNIGGLRQREVDVVLTWAANLVGGDEAELLQKQVKAPPGQRQTARSVYDLV